MNKLLYTLLTAGFLLNSVSCRAEAKKIGTEKWKNVKLGAVMGDELYTLEGDKLYMTNLLDGSRKRIGDNKYADVEFMLAAPGRLLMISEGNLSGVNAYDGASSAIGDEGEWKSTTAATVLNGKLYTLDGDQLFVTDPDIGAYKRIGEEEYPNISYLFPTFANLVMIDEKGTMTLVDPTKGTIKPCGMDKQYKGTIAGAGSVDRIFTVDKKGDLYVTEESGTTKKLGTFPNTTTVFPVPNGVVLINEAGDLTEVDIQ